MPRLSAVDAEHVPGLHLAGTGPFRPGFPRNFFGSTPAASAAAHWRTGAPQIVIPVVYLQHPDSRACSVIVFRSFHIHSLAKPDSPRTVPRRYRVSPRGYLRWKLSYPVHEAADVTFCRLSIYIFRLKLNLSPYFKAIYYTNEKAKCCIFCK